MGAVLSNPRGVVEYFGVPLTRPDLDRFQAASGDPAYNTLWEALAILIALRVWGEHFSHRTPLGIRSDNKGVLDALRARAAQSPTLNL
eukprot:12418868-Alexandrium_andersonii.AAC.1